jgi:hypothetical protein
VRRIIYIRNLSVVWFLVTDFIPSIEAFYDFVVKSNPTARQSQKSHFRVYKLNAVSLTIKENLSIIERLIIELLVKGEIWL